MNDKMIKTNNEVNELLKRGLETTLVYERMGELDMAQAILRATSVTAEMRIKASGLQTALRAFWNDKKELIEREVI